MNARLDPNFCTRLDPNFCTMLTKGEEYTDQGQAYYEERYRDRVLRQLRLRANKLGMQLVAAEQPA